jgi:hypothetical protein
MIGKKLDSTENAATHHAMRMDSTKPPASASADRMM